MDVALRRFGTTEGRLIAQWITGESYEAIAEREGLGINVIKVRIHRLRRALRITVHEADEPIRPMIRRHVSRSPATAGVRRCRGDQNHGPIMAPHESAFRS